jgi:hypothetical protein
MGVAMAVAGILTDAFGARTVWIGAGVVYLFAAFVALVLTRWLPVARAEEWDVVEASSESAAAALTNGYHPVADEAPELVGVEAGNGAATPPLERIATLLEEIEARREVEARRRS